MFISLIFQIKDKRVDPEIKTPDVKDSSMSYDVTPSSIMANDIDHTSQEVIRSMVSPSVTNVVTSMELAYPLTASKITNMGQKMEKIVHVNPLSVERSVESKMIPISGSLSDSMVIGSNYRKEISDKSWSLPLEVETNMYPQISDTREEPSDMLNANANTVNLKMSYMRYARTHANTHGDAHTHMVKNGPRFPYSNWIRVDVNLCIYLTR